MKCLPVRTNDGTCGAKFTLVLLDRLNLFVKLFCLILVVLAVAKLLLRAEAHENENAN